MHTSSGNFCTLWHVSSWFPPAQRPQRQCEAGELTPVGIRVERRADLLLHSHLHMRIHYVPASWRYMVVVVVGGLGWNSESAFTWMSLHWDTIQLKSAHTLPLDPSHEMRCCLIGCLLLGASPPDASPPLDPVAATHLLLCMPEWAMNGGRPKPARQTRVWRATLFSSGIAS